MDMRRISIRDNIATAINQYKTNSNSISHIRNHSIALNSSGVFDVWVLPW
jgi:hypothetical protein